MLTATVAPPAAEGLLGDYAILRRVEACARWVAGRGVERLPGPEGLSAVAALVEPGLAPEALRERVAETRRRIQRRWERVIAHGSISALGDVK
jgi:hypothetical protein